MIHFISRLALDYVWLLIILCKAEWWILHCRPLLVTALGYDAVKYTAWPQLRRAWWIRTAGAPAAEPDE